MFPKIYSKDIPSVNTDQMIEIDRMMKEDFNIEPLQMMENAGRQVAHMARLKFLNGSPKNYNILAMTGNGGNGGDAMVAARLLSNWGANVYVALGKEPHEMSLLAKHQLNCLQRINLIKGTSNAADVTYLQTKKFDLIIDGLIGFSLKGSPYGITGELINYANYSNTPILSIDTPSGIDAGHGTVYNPAIRAAATLTLALPKTGLFVEGVQEYLGELYLADISVPPELYSKPFLSKKVGPIFSQSEIIELVTAI